MHFFFLLLSSNKTTMSARNQIIAFAKQLRAQNPQQYGVAEAKKGTQGRVPNGWKQAVIAASAQY